MTSVQYDAAVIQQFAERLYSIARRIVVTATILGALVGLILGAVLAAAMQGRSDSFGSGSSSMLVMGVVTVLGGLLGFSYGMQRSFILRFQAQIPLFVRPRLKRTQGRNSQL